MEFTKFLPQDLDGFLNLFSLSLFDSFVVKTFVFIILMLALWYLPQIIVLFLAELKIFFLLNKEGHAIAIMRNDKFHRGILAYSGHKYKGKAELNEADPNYDDVDEYEIVTDMKSMHSDSHSLWSQAKAIIFPISGVSWIGIPGFFSVYSYTFAWVDEKYIKRDPEILESILVQPYVYGIILESIELQGGLPFRINLQVTLQIKNPIKALFRIARWYDATVERLKSSARQEFAVLAYDDFVAVSKGWQNTELETETSSTGKLNTAITNIMSFAETNIRQPLGVEVQLLQVLSIDPVDERLRELTIMQEVANREAKVTITGAEAKAREIQIISDAAALMHPNAITLQTLETVQKSGSNVTIIGEGVNFQRTFNIPLTDGTKPSETTKEK